VPPTHPKLNKTNAKNHNILGRGEIKKEERVIEYCLTSWGGTSNDTVLRSTFVYVSMHGSTKKIPATINTVTLQSID